MTDSGAQFWKTGPALRGPKEQQRGLVAGGAHVLHAEHLRRAQAGVDLALELAGGAVHGLNIDHAEAVIDRYPAALALGQVVVGVGLADGEGLPQAATPVIRHGT